MGKRKKKRNLNSNQGVHINKEKTTSNNHLYYEGSLQNNVKWYKDDGADENIESELLNNKIEITSVLPRRRKKVENLPDQMGYFETKLGTVSVGYNRYKKKGALGFTLVPDEDKAKYKIAKKDPDGQHTYFGGNFKGEKKEFRAGAISCVYEPEENDIDRIEDEKVDDEKNLIYQDDKEKNKLEKLKEIKSIRGNDTSIDREIEKIEKIKDKKEEKNLEFLGEIEKFVDEFNHRRIKMKVESEDVISRRKRIVNMSNIKTVRSDFIIILKKRLEEILNGKCEDNIRSILLEIHKAIESGLCTSIDDVIRVFIKKLNELSSCKRSSDIIKNSVKLRNDLLKIKGHMDEQRLTEIILKLTGSKW